MKLKTAQPLILASNSPRRQQLLREAGFDFEVIVRPVEEIFPEDFLPRAVVVFISENKAKAYNDLATDNLVITADTIVAKDNIILGKPEDPADAVKMLLELSGSTHEVISGVTFFYKGRFRSFAERTVVTFKTLSMNEINYYVKKYEPFDKAGGYGIQEWIGMIGITKIEGDFYNVMGLPMHRLFEELKDFGGLVIEAE